MAREPAIPKFYGAHIDAPRLAINFFNAIHPEHDQVALRKLAIWIGELVE
jgi:hypothetical protein